MGSEHSHHTHAHNNSNLKHQQSTTSTNSGVGTTNNDRVEGASAFPMQRPQSTSPRPSICSDTEIPYISYTVNRPIGESPKPPPKVHHRNIVKSARSSPVKPTKKTNTKSTHNIVVVKQAVQAETVDRDPELLKLQDRDADTFIQRKFAALMKMAKTNTIPTFLPVMRGTINVPSLRDPEVLERLDPTPVIRMGARYEIHLKLCAEDVASEQNKISQSMKDVDTVVQSIMAALTDRQRRYAKYAERLSRVREVSHSLTRCHMMLNQTLESIETLNNYLPVEDRLDSFVWTTG